MKKYLMLAFLANISIMVSCGGGGGESALPGTTVATNETCIDSSCTTTTLSTAGNFTLGQAQGPDANELPDTSVSDDGDTLSLSCGSDDTTVDGAIMFTCNLDNYEDLYAVCIHGVIYTESELDGTTTSSGCGSLNFYCDEYGFASSEICNTDNLTRNSFLLNEDEVVYTENFDLIQEILNRTPAQENE